MELNFFDLEASLIAEISEELIFGLNHPQSSIKVDLKAWENKALMIKNYKTVIRLVKIYSETKDDDDT